MRTTGSSLSEAVSRIRGFERQARALSPDAAARAPLQRAVTDHAERFLRETADGERAHFDDRGAGGCLRAAPIGEAGIGIEATLALLASAVERSGINVTSGRHLGYIPSGGIFHAALGDYLAAISNRFAGVASANPGAARLEALLVRWMAELVGYPAAAEGSLASGGSIATLTALVAARDSCAIAGADIARAVVYTTDHTHHCIEKALRIAGLGACRKRRVAVDARFRMKPAALEAAIAEDRRAGRAPWLVVGSAGTTNTGAVDPLDQIAEIAARHGLWNHVDGAYGALFALCPEGAAVLGGMERSDSIVLDPHKTLFLPFGTGAVLLRDGAKLRASFGADADYLESGAGDDPSSPADLSPELTKHFRSLRLWLPLMALGVAPFRAALSEKIHLARYFHARLGEAPGFALGPEPDLSVVTYRYIPTRGDANAFNQRLFDAIRRDGRLVITPTRIDGNLTLRAAILSIRTHLEHVDTAIDVLTTTAHRLEASA